MSLDKYSQLQSKIHPIDLPHQALDNYQKHSNPSTHRSNASLQKIANDALTKDSW